MKEFYPHVFRLLLHANVIIFSLPMIRDTPDHRWQKTKWLGKKILKSVHRILWLGHTGSFEQPCVCVGVRTPVETAPDGLRSTEGVVSLLCHTSPDFLTRSLRSQQLISPYISAEFRCRGQSGDLPLYRSVNENLFFFVLYFYYKEINQKFLHFHVSSASKCSEANCSTTG